VPVYGCWCVHSIVSHT